MITEEEVPDHWEIQTISDVIKKAVNGGTPKRSNDEYWGGDVPWLSSSEVRGKYTTETPEENITEKGLNESSAKIWPKDTVLVAMYGRGTIGRPAITSGEQSGNQAICGLIADENEIMPEFLYYWLENIRNQMAYKGRGATASQQNLNQSIIKETKVPVPPIKEQKEVVSTVESQFEILEQLISSVNKVGRDVSEYVDSHQAYLFSGRDDLSTEALPSRPTKEEIPDSWDIDHIKNITKKIRTGGTPKRSEEKYWGGDTEWRTSRHFFDDSIGLEETSEYVTRSGREETTIAERGDVLLVTRVNVGKVALVESETGFNQDIKVLRVDNSRVSSEFLAHFLLNISSYIKSIERGGTVNGITTSEVKNIEVPLPPIQEQHDIVDELKRVQNEAYETLEAIKQTGSLLQEYRNSILNYAFLGQIQNKEKQVDDRSDICDQQTQAILPHFSTQK